MSQRPPQPDADPPGPTVAAVAATHPAPVPVPPPVDDLVTSHHRVATTAGELAYTAVAGRVVLREEVHTDGVFEGLRGKAELFLTTYTLNGADPATRPVTFAFNGGPGSSSVWLHLGLLGPRRVVMGDAGALLPPPWSLTDNAETLLRDSDLVFIDPVSTGFSRVAQGGRPAEYHGFQRDLESVAETIRAWTSRHGRWLSPKYLAGESYGTLRAAALASHLQERHGLFLNGIVLISSVLDLGSIDFTEGNDDPYVLYLPTYASIAAHHGLLGDRPVAEVRAEAEALAARDYPAALARGSRLPAAERAQLVRTLAGLTGLREEVVDLADLRIEHTRFSRELLHSRRLVVGRLDGRFTGAQAPRDLEADDSWDPSLAAITGPYTAALNHWVRVGLGYTSELPYEILTNRVQPWSYADFEGRPVSVAGMLSSAMRQNPHLRVYVALGYHDGATPYFAAEQVLAQLRIPASARGRMTRQYFEAGHMMYVHEPSRLAQSDALGAFVREA